MREAGAARRGPASARREIDLARALTLACRLGAGQDDRHQAHRCAGSRFGTTRITQAEVDTGEPSPSAQACAPGTPSRRPISGFAALRRAPRARRGQHQPPARRARGDESFPVAGGGFRSSRPLHPTALQKRAAGAPALSRVTRGTHQNRPAGGPCGVGDEYADGDRQTRAVEQSAHRRPAHPNRRRHRQDARRGPCFATRRSGSDERNGRPPPETTSRASRGT